MAVVGDAEPDASPVAHVGERMLGEAPRVRVFLLRRVLAIQFVICVALSPVSSCSSSLSSSVG